MEDILEKLKRIKAEERLQLASGAPPSLTHFWDQPHGVGLVLLRGDLLQMVPTVVWDRGLSSGDRGQSNTNRYHRSAQLDWIRCS